MSIQDGLGRVWICRRYLIFLMLEAIDSRCNTSSKRCTFVSPYVQNAPSFTDRICTYNPPSNCLFFCTYLGTCIHLFTLPIKPPKSRPQILPNNQQTGLRLHLDRIFWSTEMVPLRFQIRHGDGLLPVEDLVVADA